MSGVLWFLAGYLVTGLFLAIVGLPLGTYAGMRPLRGAIVFALVSVLWGPIFAEGLLTGDLDSFVRDQTRDE